MNWSTFSGKARKSRDNRGRIFLWTILAGLIFSLLHLGSPIEDMLRDARSMTSRHAVSGDTTLIAIDNRSVKELGRFPWPRASHGKLVEELERMGAKRIVFNILFVDKSDPENDQALARALRPIGRKAVLPFVISTDPITGRDEALYPLDALASRAAVADFQVQNDFFGTARRLPYISTFNGRIHRSLAAEIAGVALHSGSFPVDFSLDPASIPVVSAIDVINGSAPRDRIAGKNVVIGTTFTPFDVSFSAPIYGTVPGAYIAILGAETLKAGPPKEYPWPFTFLPALLIVGLCFIVRKGAFSAAAIGLGIAAFFIVPFVLDRRLIFIDVVPPLFLLTSVGVALAWSDWRRRYRLRGIVNVVSGLPNLTALNQLKIDHGRALVAARVRNYAAIVSTLPAGAEKALVEQIANRLMVGAVDPTLYQGDEGIFAWFAADGAPITTGTHLEALHTLFRSPVTVDSKQFDLKISFGFDAEGSRSIANRLASALVAADEAETEGAKWKQYDPALLEDAEWRLSLLSQLDAAIDAGDLWVAYQPKLDLRTNKFVGAEALARWTHIDKGPISPIEFILAAEESNRIEKLTQFVLEHAIRAAAAINEHGLNFSMAVNLSGRLIDDPNLVSTVTEMLAKHRLKADRLTLEVTETAALSSTARNLKTLQRLRDIGVKISVDDYGTGLSTLDYLQRIPATEIKIDRSFVMGMRDNQGTKVMVNSTIQLAHSLGQEVVAEGVEDQDTLDELRRMNCDLAQGYHIGRPMTFRALSKKMLERQQRVA